MSGADLPRRAAICAAKWRASERDVLAALAQRRHLDPHDVQPVEQVGAEAAGLHLGLEVAVRGRDHAHVDARRLLVAQPLELPVLDRAQQLGLPLQRHRTHLVEQQRAAIGELEAAVAIGGRAGERALAVAEELALPDLERHRRAIDLDEGGRRASGERVQATGQQLLARARLAGESTTASTGAAASTIASACRHAALSPIRALPLVRDGAAQVAHLAPQRAAFERPLERELERVGLDGLQDVVAGARLQALDRGGHGAVSGQDQDRERRETAFSCGARGRGRPRRACAGRRGPRRRAPAPAARARPSPRRRRSRRSRARAGSRRASRGRRPRPRRPAPARAIPDRSCPTFVRRKPHPEHGAAARPRRHRELASVLSDDRMTDREPEPRRVLGREERLEDALAVGLGDARAAVLELDDGSAARRAASPRALPRPRAGLRSRSRSGSSPPGRA